MNSFPRSLCMPSIKYRCPSSETLVLVRFANCCTTPSNSLEQVTVRRCVFLPVQIGRRVNLSCSMISPLVLGALQRGPELIRAPLHPENRFSSCYFCQAFRNRPGRPTPTIDNVGNRRLGDAGFLRNEILSFHGHSYISIRNGLSSKKFHLAIFFYDISLCNAKTPRPNRKTLLFGSAPLV